ncbi:baseplate J/gp47 family protein [Dissulfurirhabdus thermomarina]|uniref:Baseplate J/gp47 family protein n=1 Tax=Dissulfurirhabdus thermomarina TaxID=1765737 RepID=A0A6N9TJ18_DISTH|nr:baseplate J/gp47 family protein [Dissulfurirhabdus thermomarina]NDY41242.1 baseplate J/gp47 family protein [Dissulfurirhabdus thermomarina]
MDRPTLQDLLARIEQDLASRLEAGSALLRRSVLGVLARVLAGTAHGLYGYLEWISSQIIPDTADSDVLDRWASWWGVSRKPAAAASGQVTLTGTDGSVVPAGTALQRADGAEYTTDADATISGGSAIVDVTAAAAGQDGNADAGTTLSLVSPVAGVDSSATVATGGLTGGADAETDDDLRARLRLRVQNPPHGGAKADYERWALEVSGVTRAWVLPGWLGAGTVGVAFVRDDDADPIPDAAEVQAVQDHLDAVRPVTAAVTVFAPTPHPVDLTIQLDPNTAAVQAAVQAELEDLFRREAAVEDGTGSGTLRISHVREAISLAEGEEDHVLVAPTADITVAQGEIATLGTITWQAL